MKATLVFLCLLRVGDVFTKPTAYLCFMMFFYPESVGVVVKAFML